MEFSEHNADLPSTCAAPIRILDIVDSAYHSNICTSDDINPLIRPWCVPKDIGTCVSKYLEYGHIPTTLVPVQLPQQLHGKLFGVYIYEHFMEMQYYDAFANPAHCVTVDYYYKLRLVYRRFLPRNSITFYLSGMDALIMCDYGTSARDICKLVILASDGILTDVVVCKEVCDLATLRSIQGPKYPIYTAEVTDVIHVLCNAVLYKCTITITLLICPKFIIYPNIYLHVDGYATDHIVLVSNLDTNTHTTIVNVCDGDPLYSNTSRAIVRAKCDENRSPQIIVFNRGAWHITSAHNSDMFTDVFPFHGGYIMRTCTTCILPGETIEKITDIQAHATVFGDTAPPGIRKYKLTWIKRMLKLQYAGRCGNTFYMHKKGVLYTWMT